MKFTTLICIYANVFSVVTNLLVMLKRVEIFDSCIVAIMANILAIIALLPFVTKKDATPNNNE